MQRRAFMAATATVAAAAAVTGTAPAAAEGQPAGPRWSARRLLRVQVVVYDGVELQDFAGPKEIFRIAKQAGLPVEASLVTTAGPARLPTADGTVLDVADGWSPRGADVVIVPGGGAGNKGEPGVGQLLDAGLFPPLLRAARRPGLTIASVCTGALVLSAAGLTRGRPCTTHHKVHERLSREGGLVKKSRVVDDGDLVTSGGITSGLDLGVWLVERELGSPAAAVVEEIAEHERRGTVWKG